MIYTGWPCWAVSWPRQTLSQAEERRRALRQTPRGAIRLRWALLICWILAAPLLAAPLQTAPLLAAPLLAAPRFSEWETETLFRRALLVQGEQGDCVWAIQAYQELLSRDITPPMQVASLYNQGLCFERQRFFAEARYNYTRIVEDFTENDVSLDARFRIGVLQELAGEFRSAERTFRWLVRQDARLPEADRRGVRVQLAWQLLMQGRHRAVLRQLTPVLASWDAMPEEERRPEQFYEGKAQVALGILLSRYALEADLKPHVGRGGLSWCLARLRNRDDAWLVRARALRETRILSARARYEQAMRSSVALWRSAAYYRLGNDAEAFFRDLNAAPIPRALVGEAREAYRRTLLERTRAEYLQSAALLYLRGHELAVESGDESEWARRLAQKVVQIEAGGIGALGVPDPLEVWRGDLGGREIRIQRPR